MAVIDLFGGEDLDGNGFSDELDDFKSQKENWLINEAHILIYEDDSFITASDENHTYDRIYVYDVKNNTPLIDYVFDSTNESDPYNSIISHLGQRTEDANGKVKYKIRVTEHINNILLRDSTNTKLGLVLSTNVNSVQNSEILDSEDETVTAIPSGSVVNTKGTVLYGSNSNVPEDKRIQLQIFYTEAN